MLKIVSWISSKSFNVPIHGLTGLFSVHILYACFTISDKECQYCTVKTETTAVVDSFHSIPIFIFPSRRSRKNPPALTYHKSFTFHQFSITGPSFLFLIFHSRQSSKMFDLKYKDNKNVPTGVLYYCTAQTGQ